MTKLPSLALPVAACLLAAACRGGPEIPTPPLDEAEAEIVAEVERLQEEIRSDPDDAAGWGALGDRYLAHGWRFEAAGCYARAEQLDPTQFDWPYLRGHALSLRDLESSLDAFARAVEIDGGYAPARIHLARTLIKLDRPDEARVQYGAVLRREPNQLEAVVGLSRLDIDAGRPALARRRLERALAVHPDAGELHHALARVYLLLGETDLAREFADSAATLPPVREMDDPRRMRALPDAGSLARTLGGRELEQAGRLEEALAEYRAALANDEAKADNHLNVGRVLRRLERDDEAESHFRRALELQPDHFAALVQYAELLERSGEVERAIELFERAIAVQPDSSRALYRLGSLRARSGRLDEGIAALRRSVELEPDHARARVNLGIALAQSGRLDEAEPEFRAAVALDPEDAEAHFNLGVLVASRADFAAAERHLATAARLAPEDAATRRALAAVRRQIENAD